MVPKRLPDWRRLTLTLAVALLAGACSTAQIDVRQNFDPDADFSRLTRFMWLGIQAPPGISEFDVKRVARAITDQLVASGLREESARNRADLGVAAYVGLYPKAVETWKRDGGLLWTRGKELASAGAISLEIVDLRRGAVVWQGVAERPLRENPTREQADRAISETVARLLADFPPASPEVRR